MISFLLEGIFTPISTSEHNFLASVVIEDVREHARELVKHLLKFQYDNVGLVACRGSGLHKVPVRVTVKPASGCLALMVDGMQ